MKNTLLLILLIFVAGISQAQDNLKLSISEEKNGITWLYQSALFSFDYSDINQLDSIYIIAHGRGFADEIITHLGNGIFDWPESIVKDTVYYDAITKKLNLGFQVNVRFSEGNTCLFLVENGTKKMIGNFPFHEYEESTEYNFKKNISLNDESINTGLIVSNLLLLTDPSLELFDQTQLLVSDEDTDTVQFSLTQVESESDDTLQLTFDIDLVTTNDFKLEFHDQSGLIATITEQDFQGGFENASLGQELKITGNEITVKIIKGKSDKIYLDNIKLAVRNRGEVVTNVEDYQLVHSTNNIKAIYDLSGRLYAEEKSLGTGLFLVKYENGNIKKIYR